MNCHVNDRRVSRWVLVSTALVAFVVCCAPVMAGHLNSDPERVPAAEVILPDGKLVTGDFHIRRVESDPEKLTTQPRGKVLLKVGEWLDFTSTGDATDTAATALSSVAARIFSLRLNVSTDKGLDGIEAFTELRQLRLVGMDKFTGSSLGAVAALPRLASFSLVGAEAVTDGGVALLGQSKSLKSIALYSCPYLSSAAINGFASAERLQELDLRDWNNIDAIAQSLAKIKTLEVLHCQANRSLTGIGLAALKDLPLRELNLQKCRGVKDKGARILGEFKSLKVLRLSGLDLKNDTLKELAKLSLEELDLSICSAFDDEGVESICQIATLKRLDLSQTQTSDKSIAALSELTALERLNLATTKISAEGLEKLKKALPKVRFNDSK